MRRLSWFKESDSSENVLCFVKWITHLLWLLRGGVRLFVHREQWTAKTGSMNSDKATRWTHKQKALTFDTNTVSAEAKLMHYPVPAFLVVFTDSIIMRWPESLYLLLFFDTVLTREKLNVQSNDIFTLETRVRTHRLKQIITRQIKEKCYTLQNTKQH